MRGLSYVIPEYSGKESPIPGTKHNLNSDQLFRKEKIVIVKNEDIHISLGWRWSTTTERGSGALPGDLAIEVEEQRQWEI